MSKELFHVNGMSCSHCEHAVKTAAGALPGVSGVEVDLKGKTVTVECDPVRVTRRQIADAIEDQGYDVVD